MNSGPAAPWSVPAAPAPFSPMRRPNSLVVSKTVRDASFLEIGATPAIGWPSIVPK
jgi:hypothetical protein